MTVRARSLARVVPRVEWRGLATSPLVVVAAVAVVLRVVLLAISPLPLFYSDSGEYLEIPHRFYLPPERPVGVSVLYKALLLVWHDLRMLVIGQAALGVATAVLATQAALLLGLRRATSLVIGLAMALSPALLVYERTMLAETLVTFLSVLAIVVVLAAARRADYAWMLVGGFTVGLIGLVRTNNVIVGVGLAIMLLVAPRSPWRTRIGLTLVMGAAAAVPLAAYGAANYVDSAARTGDGEFALSHFDGIVLFAKTAPWTDCSEPDRAPPIRAQICAAGPAYLEAGIDPIVWSPGPVNSALGSPDVADLNGDLRDLAIETMVAHPVDVFVESVETAWTALTDADIRYPARAVDAGYAGVIVDRYFGSDAARAIDSGFADALQDVHRLWTRLRAILWFAVPVAFVVGVLDRRYVALAVAMVGLFLVPLAAIAVLAPALPRYIVPYELVAFVAGGLVVEKAVARWRARERDEREVPEPAIDVRPAVHASDRRRTAVD